MTVHLSLRVSRPPRSRGGLSSGVRERVQTTGITPPGFGRSEGARIERTAGIRSHQPLPVVMSPNKKLIETYVATKNHAELAPLLADEVEWVEWADGVPASGVRHQGRTAFIQNFGEEDLRSDVTRMTEENNVVVVESTVHVTKKDGGHLTVQSCNIFELEDGKIKRLSSYGALVKDSD